MFPRHINQGKQLLVEGRNVPNNQIFIPTNAWASVFVLIWETYLYFHNFIYINSNVMVRETALVTPNYKPLNKIP